MARMQKKKPAGHKKPRISGDSAPGDNQNNDQAVTDGKDGNSESLEAKPRKTTPASKRSPGEQTFLVKLIDRYFGTWIQFLREVRSELSKVVWPTRKITTGMTGVVLVFVLIISLFLGVIDFGLSSIVRIIL